MVVKGGKDRGMRLKMRLAGRFGEKRFQRKNHGAPGIR
jgi:hypothetical protein